MEKENIKTILITGGLGLLGKKVAKELVDLGHNVIIGDVKKENEIEHKNFFNKQNFLYCNLDICNKGSIDKSINIAYEKFGNLDCCINLAYPKGKNWGKDFHEINIKIVSEHLHKQLASSIILSQRIVKFFLKQGYGNLIHFSSIQGISAPKFNHYEGTKMVSPIEYSAVKSGIIAITKWLAKYYKNKNIRVNCISPGGILDGQEKVFIDKYKSDCNSKGMLDPTDIVGTVVFLLSSDSKYINGQNIVIDDGWSL